MGVDGTKVCNGLLVGRGVSDGGRVITIPAMVVSFASAVCVYETGISAAPRRPKKPMVAATMAPETVTIATIKDDRPRTFSASTVAKGPFVLLMIG